MNHDGARDMLPFEFIFSHFSRFYLVLLSTMSQILLQAVISDLQEPVIFVQLYCVAYLNARVAETRDRTLSFF